MPYRTYLFETDELVRFAHLEPMAPHSIILSGMYTTRRTDVQNGNDFPTRPPKNADNQLVIIQVHKKATNANQPTYLRVPLCNSHSSATALFLLSLSITVIILHRRSNVI